jgi:hypothetical protein
MPARDRSSRDLAQCETNLLAASGPASRREELERAKRAEGAAAMIRKLASGEYRLYSRKVNPKTGKRRNLGTFKTLAAAKKHERAVQYFKRQ